MPLTHTTEVFNVDEAAIYKLLTDPSGGSPTYGAKTSVPGIKSVSLNPDVLAKELYGDAKVLARATKVRQIMLDASYAKLALDVLAIIAGGAVADSGVTPNQVSDYSFLGASATNYFKFEFRVLQAAVGVGSVNVTLHKARVVSFNQPAAEEDFAIPTMSIAAVALVSNDKLFNIALNETAAALSA